MQVLQDVLASDRGLLPFLVTFTLTHLSLRLQRFELVADPVDA